MVSFLCEKKDMRRRVILFAALVSLSFSCGIKEIGGGAVSGNVSGGIWGGPLPESGNEISSVCYITALDYQKGYDWRADRERESVKCSLVVFADGVPLMKVPVGSAYQVSADSDTHRIIDGHLYTDYSTDSETIIKKDGREVFRFAGRESLCGFEVHDDDIYTLGQNRDGDGFTFRRNGEILLKRPMSSVLSPMRSWDDSLSFIYLDRISSAEGDIDRYYAVRNGVVSQMAVREDIIKVWDSVCFAQDLIYVASIVGVSNPVLFTGSGMVAIPLPATAELVSASFVCRDSQTAQGSVYRGDDGVLRNAAVEVIYRLDSGIYTSLWRDGSMQAHLDRGMTLSSCCMLDGGICYTSNPTAAKDGVIYRCGERFTMPDCYCSMGANSVAMVNGIMCAGLSSLKGERPVVWKDGKLDTIKVNGYISSISAQRVGATLPR